MRTTIFGRRRGRAARLIVALAVTATSVGTEATISDAATSLRQAAPEPVDASPYAVFVADAALRSGLPEAWIWAIIRAESRGNPYAVSPAGAMGLMQIMPGTWRFERARLGLGNDPFDGRDNIMAGADYLRAMRQRYGAVGMLAAYNAGPGRYEDFRQRGRPLPMETVVYVRQLAPVVTGGVIVDDSTSAPSDPRAWTHAPLFATRLVAASAEHSVTDGVTPRAQSADKTTAASSAEPTLNKRNRTMVDAPSDGLFVPLAGPSS